MQNFGGVSVRTNVLKFSVTVLGFARYLSDRGESLQIYRTYEPSNVKNGSTMLKPLYLTYFCFHFGFTFITLLSVHKKQCKLLLLYL